MVVFLVLLFSRSSTCSQEVEFPSISRLILVREFIHQYCFFGQTAIRFYSLRKKLRTKIFHEGWFVYVRNSCRTSASQRRLSTKNNRLCLQSYIKTIVGVSVKVSNGLDRTTNTWTGDWRHSLKKKKKGYDVLKKVRTLTSREVIG